MKKVALITLYIVGSQLVCMLVSQIPLFAIYSPHTNVQLVSYLSTKTWNSQHFPKFIPEFPHKQTKWRYGWRKRKGISCTISTILGQKKSVFSIQDPCTSSVIYLDTVKSKIKPFFPIPRQIPTKQFHLFLKYSPKSHVMQLPRAYLIFKSACTDAPKYHNPLITSVLKCILLVCNPFLRPDALHRYLNFSPSLCIAICLALCVAPRVVDSGPKSPLVSPKLCPQS